MNLSCLVASKELMFMRLWGTVWCKQGKVLRKTRRCTWQCCKSVCCSILQQTRSQCSRETPKCAQDVMPRGKARTSSNEWQLWKQEKGSGGEEKNLPIWCNLKVKRLPQTYFNSLEWLWNVEEVEHCCRKWGATLGMTLNFCSSAPLSVHSTSWVGASRLLLCLTWQDRLSPSGTVSQNEAFLPENCCCQGILS